jgi:hypothetical protein
MIGGRWKASAQPHRPPTTAGIVPVRPHPCDAATSPRRPNDAAGIKPVIRAGSITTNLTSSCKEGKTLALFDRRSDLACRREKATPAASKAVPRGQGHHVMLKTAELVRMARANPCTRVAYPSTWEWREDFPQSQVGSRSSVFAATPATIAGEEVRRRPKVNASVPHGPGGFLRQTTAQ